jgi:hypothetical protein
VELYHELFGDWKRWKKFTLVQKPEAIEPIIRKIREVLFWDKPT